jgi:hypothetical protein
MRGWGRSSLLPKQKAFSLHLRSGTSLNRLNSWTWDFVLVLRRPIETTPVTGNCLLGRSEGGFPSYRESRLPGQGEAEASPGVGRSRPWLWQDGRLHGPYVPPNYVNTAGQDSEIRSSIRGSSADLDQKPHA